MWHDMEGYGVKRKTALVNTAKQLVVMTNCNLQDKASMMKRSHLLSAVIATSPGEFVQTGSF
jgi:hypothetical protein